jgi:hypothetical protein
MTTDDLMFAVEDNTDDEDMMDYYSKRGIVGEYVGKRAETLGLDISEIPIIEIKNMKLIDADGIETTLFEGWWNEEIWKSVSM